MEWRTHSPPSSYVVIRLRAHTRTYMRLSHKFVCPSLGVELFLDVGEIIRIEKNQTRLIEIETKKSSTFTAKVFIDASYEGGK